ncbi:MAG TPA: 1-phosphofructokinase family hexose kinase [Chitinophagaceae bacterium]|nr:1-phosphofructokinase family hexose kinase [Chitinophagaceae bacterium]
MPDIITITLNPAIDKNYTVERLAPEHKLRCPNPRIDPGGGGINVAKALKELGTDALALFFSGGRNGAYLQDLLHELSLNIHPIAIDGETRESVVIVDKASGKEYRIVVEGPEISLASLDEVIRQLESNKPSYIVASGSIPKGLPEDAFARIAVAAKELNARFIADTSGAPLKHAVDAGVFLLKPNLRELSALVGVESLQLNDVDDAAMDLIKKGKCEVVVVSLSSSGAMLVNGDGYHHIPAPTVERKSTVGAGDSMVAGMVWSLMQGKSYLDMAMMGVACGTAATMSPGTQLFRKADAEKLLQWITGRK